MSLKRIADNLKFLSKRLGLEADNYGGLRGLTGDTESIVHELAHAVVLRLPLAGHFDLSAEIGNEITKLDTDMQKDWQEVLTLACEVVVLRRLGVHIATDGLISDAASKMSYFNTLTWGGKFDYSKLKTLVHRHARTKTTQRRAKVILDLLLPSSV